MLRLHYDLGVVDHGPLPPHERTWRHPSELAAQEHAFARTETAAATTRVFAFTTGTLGLLVVGLLVVAVTPNASEPPVAVSATTTVAGDRFPTVTRVAAAAATEPSVGEPIPLRGRPEAMATPIGEGQFAVVTAADLAATAGPAVVGAAVEVVVPSGRMHAARVIGVAGDTVLVELERTEPGIDLAVGHPDGHEIVTVLTEPPVTIVLDDLSTLAFDEGTAVLDGDGDLVGLCSRGVGDATRLVFVSDKMLDRDDSEHDEIDDGPAARLDVVAGPTDPELDDELSDEPAVATTDG